AVFFYLLIGFNPELKLLYLVVMTIDLIALIIAVVLLEKFATKSPLLTVLIHLGIALIFLLIGIYLGDQLRYEIVESVGIDPADSAAKVVKARLVTYGGADFFLIYCVNAALAYLPFVSFSFNKREAESTDFSGQLFSVKIGKKVYLIPYEEIDYIEASGNYIQIIKNEQRYSARLTLQEFLDQARSEKLCRIHRSFIVNLNRISELEQLTDGYAVILKNGKKLKIGKQYKTELLRLLGVPSA
ncbi:MAG: LytTR family transcriptional regulator, partial [Calditrichaeota bacterium]|nr:LytTR family transcriptional regulator [Calditrichota bacterium]